MTSTAARESILQASARQDRRALSLVWPAIALYLVTLLSSYTFATAPGLAEMAGSLASVPVATGLGLLGWLQLQFRPQTRRYS